MKQKGGLEVNSVERVRTSPRWQAAGVPGRKASSWMIKKWVGLWNPAYSQFESWLCYSLQTNLDKKFNGFGSPFSYLWMVVLVFVLWNFCQYWSEVAQLCLTLCNPMDRLLRPWDFPGKSTGVGCHFLLQRIFPTQGSNLGLLHCRHILYWLSYEGNPMFSFWILCYEYQNLPEKFNFKI